MLALSPRRTRVLLQAHAETAKPAAAPGASPPPPGLAGALPPPGLLQGQVGATMEYVFNQKPCLQGPTSGFIP